MKAISDSIAHSDVSSSDSSHNQARKPGMPPLLPASLLVWASCAAVYDFAFSLQVETLRDVALLAIVVSIVLSIALFVAKRKVVFACLLSITIGVLLGCSGALQVKASSTLALGLGEQRWTIELTEDVQISDYGSRASGVATFQSGQKCSVQVYFSDDVSLLATEQIVAYAQLKPIAENSAQYWWRKGVLASISVSNFEMSESGGPAQLISSARKSAIETIDENCSDVSGILQALVCGYRNTISQNGDYEKFKICGLAHVVAVSGAHLAIVISVFMYFLKRLRLNRNLSVALSIVFVLFYLLFAGIPISAIRSAIMVVLTLLSSLAKRRSHPINALAITIVAFLVHDPVASVSVSLFLSAASTLGIMMFASLITSWIEFRNRKLNEWVVEPCALTLASNIATLPFSVALFSQLSTISIAANIVATPLFSLACVVGLVSTVISLMVPPLAFALMTISSLCTFPLNLAVDLLSQIPYAAIAINAEMLVMLLFSTGISVALWLVWPTFKRRGCIAAFTTISAFMIAVVLIVPLFARDEIVVLDVGQGDAILLRSGGKNVLIDTGNQETKLKNSLADLGIFTLDAVIVTHSDDDHMGVLGDMRGWIQVNSVFAANDALTCVCNKCDELRSSASELKGLKIGDIIKIGAFEARVVWPYNYRDEGGNGDSVCLKLSRDTNRDGESEITMLLTGDAESDEISSIIENGSIGDIDILKVGHHGSKVSLSDKILDTLRPEVSLISCGKNNRYGHPKQETLDFLHKYGAKIYRTDEDGRITIIPNERGYEVKAQNR